MQFAAYVSYAYAFFIAEKESLLSRLFRRSKRSQCHIGTFSAQFPPTEWFNSKAVHLHNVGTQTAATEKVNRYRQIIVNRFNS